MTRWWRPLLAVALLGAATTMAGPSPAARGAQDEPSPETPVDEGEVTTTLPASFEDDGVRITRGVETAVVDGVSLTVDVYQPAEAGTGRPAIVLVHGGAWFQGSPADMAPQARLVAEQGWVAFSVSYRLATNDVPSWPLALADVQRQVRWVGANAASFGADPAKIALLGSSAGGHLAALIASVGTVDLSVLTGTGSPDENPPVDVAAVVAWSPPTELAPLAGQNDQPPETCGVNEFCREFWKFPFVQTFVGCQPLDCPDTYDQASPVSWVTTETTPIWISNSSDEIVPVGQLQEMAGELELAGVDHSIDILQGTAHAHEYTEVVWNDMTPWLADHLGVPQPNPIVFPARGSGFSPELALALGAMVLLLALLFGAVWLTGRRAAPELAPGTT